MNVGYSAGVESALFNTDLRNKNELSTSALVLIGPNYPTDGLFAIDTNGNSMFADDFVARVAAVSKYTPVLIVDDTKQYEGLFSEKYPDANVSFMDPYQHNTDTKHADLDDYDWIREETINWLGSIGVK